MKTDASASGKIVALMVQSRFMPDHQRNIMSSRTPRAVAVYDLPSIIIAEFDEQPALRLTFPQVQRLWGLSPDECRNVLEYLVSSGELVHDDDDRYCRPLTAQTC